MAQDNKHQMLADRYEVRELIGRGGMAAVHIGYDTRLSRTVAVKMLRADLARDPIFQARFRREAQSAAALNHPAIVAVYDTGEDPSPTGDGTIPYIVMEYVEGRTVRDLLSGGDAVPIDEAVEITCGVLDALEYSHRMGIVHRDIKPGNIMITPQGAVKVMDFGIARAVADSAATMTEASSVVGTAQYLSPEQARGEQVDSRSDLYSTGCLLFELLTGQPPFSGDSAVAVAYQHVRETPRTPSSVAADVPESLDRVVLKALAKDREDRYSDAAHFRKDLQSAEHGGPVEAPATAVWGAAGAISQDAAAPTAMMNAAPGDTMAGGTTTMAPSHAAEVEEQEKKKQPWWLWILLGVLALVALIFGLTQLTGNNQEPVATTTVPALAGMDQTQARQAVEAANLVFALGEPEASTDVPEGQFTSSDPAVGARVDVGTTVTARFSGGPESITVPDVTGMTQAEARTALQDAGLTVGDVQEVDGPGTAGEVVSTDPAAGTALRAGDSVALSIASGRATMPDLRGMSQSDAQNALRELGLVGIVERADEPGAADTVLRTDPSAGSTVSADSQVTLTIPSGDVVLPDLAGMSRSQAEAKLAELGLAGNFVEEPTDQEAPGTVVSMNRSPGRVAAGTTIEVFVAQAPPQEPTQSPSPTDGSTPTPTDSPTDGGNGGN